MSVQYVDRGHLQRDEATESAAASLRTVINDLPTDRQDEVFNELMLVVADYDRTRRIDPVIHFVESPRDCAAAP